MILGDLQGAMEKVQGTRRKVQGARRMPYGPRGDNFIFFSHALRENP
jgi:hypothetical protein